MSSVLNEFYSIGDKSADLLWKRLLELKLVEEGKIYTHEEMRVILRKILKELPVATQEDIKYNPLRIIPRKYITLIDNEIQKVPGIDIAIFGSYYRGKPTSGDIDMVLTKGKDVFEKFMEYINNNSKKIRIMPPYQNGEDRICFLIQLFDYDCYVKADIFLTEKEDRMYAELFATGSGKFNILMRVRAKANGYLLNQYGLFKNDKKVKVKNEKHLFELLGMSYRTPEQR